MEALEPNMYVRTDEGIRKIIEDYDEGYELDKSLHYLYPEGHDLYKDDLEELDIKASHNIIDLIEVGDYVNGYLVKDIDYAFDDVVMNNKNARIVPYIDCNKNNYIDDIKSIVTKEQFESISYEVK